jgi:hypothetical protein
MTPNAFAWIALGAWPFVALAAFALRRTSIARTTAWMIVLPLMFLPTRVGLKFAPGVPELDKHRIAFVSIAICLTLFARRSFGEALRAHAFARLVLAVLVFGAVQTVQTNGDLLRYGPTVLPALTSHDIASLVGILLLDYYLPFAVAERVFRTERDVCDLFEVLSTALLVYTPFIAFELRFSPQLHRWVYGYHQHEFGQMMRDGGFRPMLFMAHGLYLAMFVFTAYVASRGLAELRVPLRPTARMRSGIAAVVLLACKSLGSILYGLAATGVHGVFRASARGRIAATIALLVLAYPVLRAEQVFPRNEIVTFFNRINPERAQSLLFRLDMEELLLARARERPLYGWGSWGRNHVHAGWGGRLTIVDGQWVLMLGTLGYVGFAGFFAFLLVPIFRFARNERRLSPTARLIGGTLTLMVAFCALDLIPNSRQDFLSFTFAGALFALSRARRASARAPDASGRGPPPDARGVVAEGLGSARQQQSQ